MKKIDLNCDMAELMPGQSSNFDAEIMPFISSCNIACGFHSGNPRVIEQSIRSAIAHEVKIGAHPSYNDPDHFGRKSIEIDLEILIPELRYQIAAVKGIVESFGSRLNHVKPHGALYNDMAKNSPLATAFVLLIKEIDPTLEIYGLAESVFASVCAEHGMKFVREGFADRRYQSRSQLRKRSLDDAVISESTEVIKQLELFSHGKVELYNGEVLDLEIDSLCLHSDTKGAIELSKVINEYFKSKNIAVG